jgi:hypothetical protein
VTAPSQNSAEQREQRGTASRFPMIDDEKETVTQAPGSWLDSSANRRAVESGQYAVLDRARLAA